MEQPIKDEKIRLLEEQKAICAAERENYEAQIKRMLETVDLTEKEKEAVMRAHQRQMQLTDSCMKLAEEARKTNWKDTLLTIGGSILLGLAIGLLL